MIDDILTFSKHHKRKEEKCCREERDSCRPHGEQTSKSCKKEKKYICKQKWFISSTLLPLLFHIFRTMYGSYFKLESYQTYFAMPWYSST